MPSVVYALDFSSWKRSSVRQCFPGSKVRFITNVTVVPAGGVLVVWGLRSVKEELAAEVQIVHLEDGFLRSVGLGADLVRPMSWVIDKLGLYYDATQPSDLEVLLAETVVTEALLGRAASLRKRIVDEGITKYNVGNASWQRPEGRSRVILVPGQVESDASLAYGAPKISTNIRLLQTVREANANAYVVYKPHPDVISGLRLKGLEEEDAQGWCDEIVTNVTMESLLMAVDEVHVLTSLTGFEALLRGKAVTCYGQPFYAGWGLTFDVVPILRRSRKLLLDELVAGALINYPLYLSRHSMALITPEQALDELLLWRANTDGIDPWWRTYFRMLLRCVVGVR